MNKSQLYFLLSAKAVKTTQPIELWLDPVGGNDANSGEDDAHPIKTLPRAYSRIPLYPAPIRINVAAGDVEWVPVPPFLKDSLVLFYGTPGTNLLQEVAQAGTGATQVVASTVLVPNARRGDTLEITSGPAAGVRKTVRSNDASAIVPSVAYDSNPVNPVPAPGDTFRVYRPGTTFSGVDYVGGGPGPGFGGQGSTGRQGGVVFWCSKLTPKVGFATIAVEGYTEFWGCETDGPFGLSLLEGAVAVTGLDPYLDYYDFFDALVPTPPALTAQFGIEVYGGYGLTTSFGVNVASYAAFIGCSVVRTFNGSWSLSNAGSMLITSGHTPFYMGNNGLLTTLPGSSVPCTLGDVAGTIAKLRVGPLGKVALYGNTLVQSSVAGPLLRVQGGLLTIGSYVGFDPSGAAPSGLTVQARRAGRILCYGPPQIGRGGVDLDWQCETVSANKSALAASGSRIADPTRPESIILNQGPEFFF